MSRLFIFARLPVHSVAARDELLGIVAPVTEYAQSSEPGVTKYAGLLARDDPNDLAVYMIEEYATKEAFESHVATEGVKKLMAWLGTPGNTDGTPDVHFLELTDHEYVSPGAINSADPYVVVSTFAFPNGKAEASVERFERPFLAATKQRGTLLYGIYTDRDSKDIILTAESYENGSQGQQYADPAVAGGLERTTMLILRHGFLHKQG